MTWFFAVLIVVVMGVVAVVAAGQGGSMAEVYDDRPDARVQADGPLTARDVREVRFTTAVRGYRMSEVDTLLDRLATELETLEAFRLEWSTDAADGGGAGSASPDSASGAAEPRPGAAGSGTPEPGEHR